MPIGLRRYEALHPGGVPFAWAANGFASVVAAALATVLALVFGFTVTTIVACALLRGSARARPIRQVGTARHRRSLEPGGVAERTNAVVLKTTGWRHPAGSNPAPSANRRSHEARARLPGPGTRRRRYQEPAAGKMLIARAMTRSATTRETLDSAMTRSLAHGFTADTSVGLNAVAVLNDIAR